ncbi:hypothetical protein [Roseobacter cerasinus]|nr:hypothetical protein [Roseobacter cerasinus]
MPMQKSKPDFLDLCGDVPPPTGHRGMVQVDAQVITALMEDYPADVLFIEMLHQFAVRCARHVLPEGRARLLPVSIARLRLMPLTGPVTLRARVFPEGRVVSVVIGGRFAEGPWQPLAMVRVAPVPVGAT